MAYHSDVVQRATDKLKENARQHREQFDLRRERIYRQIPELSAIERQMSQTVRRAAQTALVKDLDPAPVIQRAKEQNLALQARRDSLLAAGGYQKEDLTYRPRCRWCEDKGWRGAEMCRCLQELCAQEQVKELSSMLDLGDQSFDTFDLDYYSPIFDHEIDCSPRIRMELSLAICFAFADKFGKSKVRNLFLTGGPGLGKTFLSASIARVVSEKGYSVVYDSAINVFNRFDAQKFGRDSRADSDVERYLTCDLMILDDLGSETNTPFALAALYQLINTRLVMNRSTVISSNLSPTELESRYNPSIASRINGDYTHVLFYGEDIRKQKKDRGDHMF